MPSEVSRQKCDLEVIFGLFRRHGERNVKRKETDLGSPSLARTGSANQLHKLRGEGAVAARGVRSTDEG